MNALMERTASTPESWRAAATAIFRAGEAMLEAGQRPHVVLDEEADTLTLRQMRFIHGPILQQISEQVRVNGVQYTREMWKIHLKDLFMPDKFEMVQAPFVRDRKTGAWRPSKREVPRKLPKSLKDLTGKSRSEFIDAVLAHAATAWGVEFVFIFDEREAVRYRPPQRKTKPAQLPAPVARGEAVTA
ncbi:MAG: hypothetical protein ACT6S0_04785 [Roseateles sp.]|uniref:hypothetical protein n=1 Tax=Roseateles sp. TaxID=1971397 RepID=UPI0040369F42